MLRIAIDAMGGDHAPDEIVVGTISALQANEQLSVLLVGPTERLEELLAPVDARIRQRITIVHASEVITNDEAPAMAVRRKKDASIVVATRLLKEGEADGLLTAGSTGAFMAAGLLILGRLPGVQRPALAPILPTVDGNGVVLLDVGANMDATPDHLLQYAIMGSIYAEQVLGRPKPRVGLLNVGSEPGKGNEVVKAAFELLSGQPLNFIGNLEARDLLAGAADVVVADGFVGNVVLKFMEGMALGLFTMLQEEFTSDLRSKLGAGLLLPGLKRFKRKLDYSEHGGAPLLGVKAPMIKCHGSSKGRAIHNGIYQAVKFIENRSGEVISRTIGEVK
ncbi:MAG TPA: phosphate acyltransferase PlsX [Firmicutes bacterium]|nr:phosphate acyltransferase PlsX [Bacillota bacterium]